MYTLPCFCFVLFEKCSMVQWALCIHEFYIHEFNQLWDTNNLNRKILYVLKVYWIFSLFPKQSNITITYNVWAKLCGRLCVLCKHSVISYKGLEHLWIVDTWGGSWNHSPRLPRDNSIVIEHIDSRAQIQILAPPLPS